MQGVGLQVRDDKMPVFWCLTAVMLHDILEASDDCRAGAFEEWLGKSSHPSPWKCTVTVFRKEEDKMRKVTRLTGTIVVLALLLTLGLGACDRASSDRSATSDTLPAPTNTPSPPTATPVPTVVTPAAMPEAGAATSPLPAQSLLVDSLKAMEGTDSWHVEVVGVMTMYYKGLSMDIPVTYAGDFSAPDRLEGKLSMDILWNKLERDTVLISRILDAPEPGTGKTVSNVQPVPLVSLLDFVEFEPNDIPNLELVGEETLDGTPVYHLKGGVSAVEMEIVQLGTKFTLEGEVALDILIGIDDSLPRQVSADGSLAVSGGAQGTLHMAGTATFSGYGSPLDAEAPGQTVPTAGNLSCGALASGFVPYSSEAAATKFCYPSDWVVDDAIDQCGLFGVSTTGLGSGRSIPASLVLVYPDKTVTRFGSSAAGAAEVAGRTAVCFFRVVLGSVLQGNATIIDLTPQQQAKAPIMGVVTGIQHGDAKGVSLSLHSNPEQYGPTVEAITYSIEVGKPAAR